MKDLILGFKLLKYSYKLRTNVIMLLLFTVIGFVVEFQTKGTNMLGGFYFMLTGMFAFQMMVYMNAADYVQSSAMKRKLETVVPVLVSTAVYLVLLTLLVAEKYILIRKFPELEETYMNTFFTIILVLFMAMIFTGVCYKYFVVSMIVLFVLIGAGTGAANLWLVKKYIFANMDAGFVKLAIFGYVAIILGGVMEYVLSSALYKKQLSELAMSGFNKSMK